MLGQAGRCGKSELDLPVRRATLSYPIAMQEAVMDEETLKTPKLHEVGMPIDTMSVDELQQRIGLLETEIARLKAAIAARGETRQAAESVFKF